MNLDDKIEKETGKRLLTPEQDRKINNLSIAEKFIENWDAIQNLPVLTASAPGPESTYYLIRVNNAEGKVTTTITGESIEVQDGGRLISNGTKFSYDPPSKAPAKPASGSVNLESVSPDLFKDFNGKRAYTKRSSTSEKYLLIDTVFDTQGLTIDANSDMVVGYDFFAQDPNVVSLNSRLYLNDSPAVGDISGAPKSNLYTSPYATGTLVRYSKTREKYVPAYRYIHVYMLIGVNDLTPFTTFFFKNVSLSVGGQSALQVAQGLFVNVGGSTITEAVTIPTNLITKEQTQNLVATQKVIAVQEANTYTLDQINAMRPASVDGYLFHAKVNANNIIQPVIGFDVSGIAFSGSHTLKVKSKVANKANVSGNGQLRVFYSNNPTLTDVSGANSVTGFGAAAFPVGSTTAFEATRSSTLAKTTYIKVFFDIQVTSLVDFADFLLYDLELYVNDVKATKLSGAGLFNKAAADTVTPQTILDDAFATVKVVGEKIDAAKPGIVNEANTYTNQSITVLKNLTPIDGHKFVASGNTQNTTLIQPIFLFDTNGIDYLAGDSMKFSMKLVDRTGNITKINQVRAFVNDSAVFDNTSGSIGVFATASQAPVVNVPLLYESTRNLSVKARYIHLFPDLLLTVPTLLTTFDVFEIKLSITKAGTTVAIPVPRISGAAIYRKNTADGVIPITQLDDDLVNAKYVETQFARRNKLKDKKINRIGNSLTSGQGNVGTANTYGAVVSARNGMIDRNYGISGTTLAGLSSAAGPSMVSRYSDMVNDADYVIVGGGTNDFRDSIPIGTNADTTITTFKGALNTLCKGLIEKYPKAKIGFITPMNSRPNEGHKPYADAMIEICSQWGISVLDFYRKSGINSLNAIQAAALMLPSDQIHPNESGHLKLADIYEDWLLTL